MALEIRVLGRVDALIDGQALPLGGSKQRAVLAMLALRANRTVATEELIDGLWGDRPPARAPKNVQHYVWRLRTVLGRDDSGAAIVTRGRGYVLQLPDDAVDAARFERLVERARREAEGGIADGAAQGALELWRGAPLADVASEPFAGPEIRRLEELRLRALELAIDAELAAGRHADAIGGLEALIGEHPAHERFHAQRMLALYRAGRQSEAVEGYRAAHRTLVEQIGVEPGPELRELQEAILRHDPALDAPPPPQELPRQLEGGSPLIAGRDRELRWLRKRWAEAEAGRTRVALVCGPAGIGKTRLAAELAAAVQPEATVIYAAGSGAPDSALEAIRGAEESERPTLLVVDDADDASPAMLAPAAALAAKPRDTPLLLLVLHRDEQGPPAFAVTEHRLVLRPLQVEAAAEIAELYAPADGMAMPLETLMAESEGVPLGVHRAASGWAQAQVAERLEATVGRAATERGGLRVAETEVAGSVADLQVARERTSLYVVEEPPDPAAAEVCPFRGLAPFDSAHAEYFFGRERLVAALVARLVGSTLLAVVGPSGSGKSSVLRAGLLPSLADGVIPGSERWRQVVMRPGEHPLAELTGALARVAPKRSEPDGDDPLAGALDSLRADAPLVLAVDQLEEIFTACRDEGERAAFAAALAALAADADHRVVVVLGIRGDFYDRCADYAELSGQMSANNVLVGPMRRDELRRAIELPAKLAGLRVEPSLVSALVGDVADEPGGLPLLSTTLVELWEERRGRTLRRASYEARRGAGGAVARLAERAYQRLSSPQRGRARAILLRLTDAEQPAPVRRRVPLSELEDQRDEDAAAALAVLTESRLVTVDEGTVEVAHEALLREWPRLRAWLEEDVEGRRLHQHLIHAAGEWHTAARDPAELYRGARLASALDWAASHDPQLNELERQFLDESRAASEREAERQRRTNRRLRTLLAGVGALLAAAVVAGVIAISERQGARSAAAAEAAQRLGAQALTEDRLDRAALLASTGIALDDSLETRSSLLSTLVRNPPMLGILRTDGDELLAIALSPDGRTLALGDADGTVSLFDTETRERLGNYQGPGYVTDLAFDPDGGSLAVVARDERGGGLAAFRGSLQILDAETVRRRGSITLGHKRDSVTGRIRDYFPKLTYAADGRSVIVAYVDRSDYALPLLLRRFDARNGSPLGNAVRAAPSSGAEWSEVVATPNGPLLYPTPEATYAIDPETLRMVRRYRVGGSTAAVSADAATLAIGGGDGRVRLLDLASARVQTLRGRHSGTVQELDFAADGRALVSGSEDKKVKVWDLGAERAAETLTGHDGGGLDLALAPNGRTLYTASTDSTAIIWDVAGDRRLARLFTTGLVRMIDVFPPGFDVSPDGRMLAVARLDGRVDLIDAETLRRRRSFEAFAPFEDRRGVFPNPALTIEYTPDGRRLAVASGRGLVGLWDARSGRRVGALLHGPPRRCVEHPTFPSLCDIVQALAVGRGGLLAAAEFERAVHIWDLGSRKLIGRIRVPPLVLGMAFSPDGSQLAIATGWDSNHPAVEVRDPRSGKRLARLPTNSQVRSLAFSPDGGLLAGGHADGGALLWETDGWRQVGALDLRATQAEGLAFSPDGRTLATSHDDGTVVLWDVEARQPLGTLPGPTGRRTMARFTPDGSRLFAVYDNGTAARWEVDPAAWRRQGCILAGGGPTPEQWEEIVPEQDYRQVCPE